MENKMESEKKMSESGEEHRESRTKTKQLGGIKTLPTILANEACDKFASTGFHANMIIYLTKVLNLPLVKASNILTSFDGTANFTPLFGALIADSFAGRFWTIIFGSIIYTLGMVTITVFAFVPSLHPSPCPTQQNCKEASSLQLWILYISLLLQAIGTGGIRPCVVTFAADQFDMTKSKVEARKWNLFNWYYISMGVATILALTVVVYVQDNVGWGWGLGIPTIALILSTIAFIGGSPLYRKVKPGGSPLVRLTQVIFAAFKKRNVVTPADSSLLYENKALDAGILSSGMLLHTNHLRWLDQAAIVTDRDIDDSNQPNLWRLSTVHRVEELKSMIRILPIWAAAILLITSYSNQHNFTIQQARTMDRHLSPSFAIPPASLAIFSVSTLVIGLALYERLFVPLARRITGNPTGITYLQRIGIGFVVNILATIVSALVEIKRKQVAANHNLLDKPIAVIPISVFWLAPQFCLHGIGEVFMSVGLLEFLYDQSPESMKSIAVALSSISMSLGKYFGTILASSVHKYSGKERNWLPDRNLNRGRLENYYWLTTGIQVVNLIYYLICAWFYNYKPLDLAIEGRNAMDLELARERILPVDSSVKAETEQERIGTCSNCLYIS